MKGQIPNTVIVPPEGTQTRHEVHPGAAAGAGCGGAIRS